MDRARPALAALALPFAETVLFKEAERQVVAQLAALRAEVHGKGTVGFATRQSIVRL
jgi:hypothetical protein